MSLIEIIAVVFSLISIVQTIQQNYWCWITGIIGIVAYLFLFQEQKLYCQMILQIVFIIQSIYGLLNWGKTKNHLPVTTLSNTKFGWYILTTGIISFIMLGILRDNFNSSQPVLDVVTTTLSLLATWYLTKKYIDNWIIWIVTDFFFIIMFINQHLFLSAFLYFIFLLLAIKGFISWRKSSTTV